MIGWILLGILVLLARRYLKAFKTQAFGLDDFRKSGFVQKDFMAVRKLKRNQVLVILSETVRPPSKLLLQHLCSTQLRKTVFLCNVDASSQPQGELPHKWKSPVEFHRSNSPQQDILQQTEPEDFLVFATDTHKIFNGVIELQDQTLDYFQREPWTDRIQTVKATKEQGLQTWSIRQSICVSRNQLERVLGDIQPLEMPHTMLSWNASWIFLWNQFVWTSLQAMSVLVTETSETQDPPQEPLVHTKDKQTAHTAHISINHKDSEIIWHAQEQCPS